MAKSNIEKLMELKQLYEQGILTKDEMEAEKAKILNASTSPDESPNNEIPSVEDAGSSFASNSDEESHGRNKVIIGIAAVIVVAIVAIIGFFLNKHSEPPKVATDDIELSQLAGGDNMNEGFDDIREVDSSTSATINAINKVEDLMKNCSWIEHNEGFQYPDFFEQHQVFLDEIPADVEIYNYDSIELCYWPSLGVWSVADEFPSEGLYLSPTETVKNVTYRAESKGIASGYTNSGKIYYLKQKIMHGEGVDHSKFLVLINPTEYNKSVEKITNMVAKW